MIIVHMLRTAVLSILLCLSVAPGAAGAPGKDFGRLNPEAPPETAQFAFLLGEWNCSTRFVMPDGSGYGEGKATWTGY